MSIKSVFTGPGDRARLLALGDVDQRERDAVKQAQARRCPTCGQPAHIRLAVSS